MFRTSLITSRVTCTVLLKFKDDTSKGTCRASIRLARALASTFCFLAPGMSRRRHNLLYSWRKFTCMASPMAKKPKTSLWLSDLKTREQQNIPAPSLSTTRVNTLVFPEESLSRRSISIALGWIESASFNERVAVPVKRKELRHVLQSTGREQRCDNVRDKA